jgi:hypothetical protein
MLVVSHFLLNADVFLSVNNTSCRLVLAVTVELVWRVRCYNGKNLTTPVFIVIVAIVCMWVCSQSHLLH